MISETSSAPANVVTMRNVVFSYGAFPVLEDVSLDIPAGAMMAVVGPNGGGKTTLLRLMLGLLTPNQGRIEILGLPPSKARTHIGYVPQHWSFDLQFPVRVMDVVVMGRLRGAGLPSAYSAADRERAQKALEEVGLGEFASRPFSALSGGQRQRVLIARALATDPELMLLDEPTAYVDILAEKELHELLHELNRRMTIVMVTHDLSFVHTCVRSVICVNRRVAEHPTSEITGENIHVVYGRDVRVIRHDKECRHGEHGDDGTHAHG